MTPPPIYGHAQKLYAAFEQSPTTIEADEQLSQEFGVPLGAKLYLGHWSTQFIKHPDLPGESTQQKAYAWLQEKGCIEVLRRGGREYYGVILLCREPTVEDCEDTGLDTRASRAGQLGVVKVAVDSLTNKVNDLEDGLNLLSGQYAALTRDVELSLRKINARIDNESF